LDSFLGRVHPAPDKRPEAADDADYALQRSGAFKQPDKNHDVANEHRKSHESHQNEHSAIPPIAFLLRQCCIIDTVDSNAYFPTLKLARRYSLFIRTINPVLISLGHTASHSRCIVQLPKPSLSIAATILSTRVSRSGCP